MTEAPTKVIDAGRVTIPADVRRELGIEQGDYVMVDVKPLPAGDGWMSEEVAAVVAHSHESGEDGKAQGCNPVWIY